MAKLMYLLGKPRKEDNVAGTGVVWIGRGDVQDVPDDKVEAFLKHPSIWALVVDNEPEPVTSSSCSEPRFVLEHDSGSTLVLDDMDDAALRAFVAEHGLKVHHKAKGDTLRRAIVDAIKKGA